PRPRPPPPRGALRPPPRRRLPRRPPPLRRPPLARRDSASARCGSRRAGNSAARKREAERGRLGSRLSSPRPAPRGRVLGPETRPLAGQSDRSATPRLPLRRKPARHLDSRPRPDPRTSTSPSRVLFPSAPGFLHLGRPGYRHRWPQIFTRVAVLFCRIESQARSG
ncbi:PREDICTED: serine/arginine repetitive matrix protein 1-like, partial [Chinchilla lanigera]|uniref:serine/arginine repetitive matrix protein 1-like n=1 Tax=Chinchilla lanigera TaxID=34839 RepID=UPI000698EA5F